MARQWFFLYRVLKLTDLGKYSYQTALSTCATCLYTKKLAVGSTEITPKSVECGVIGLFEKSLFE